MRKYALLLLMSFALSYCSHINMDDEPPTFEKLLNTPDTVRVANQTFILSTYLNRDFMPIIPLGGSGLTATAYLETKDHSPITGTIIFDTIYIIKRSIYWESGFVETAPTEQPYKLGKIMRNGPAWDTGITVDVVVKFMVNGQTYKVKAGNQLIHRTD